MEQEMRKAGSKIPDMVKTLQDAGWVTYEHHDNWFRNEEKPTDGKAHVGHDLHDAYAIVTGGQTKLAQAVEIVCTALRTDSGYYESWKANIAMSMYDEYMERDKKDGIVDIHEVANKGADRFLQLLIYKPMNTTNQ